MDERAGYRSDSEYILSYQAELAPAAIDFAVLLSGHRPPTGRRYLELGFGRGRSINIHAAARPGDYSGVDFNPAHAEEAAALAEASGAPIRVFGESFGEFAARETIEPADYIVLHGIWSWTPPEARAAILAIIDRALAPGGVVSVSYDALPGAAAKAVVRDLLRMQGGDAATALAKLRALKDAEAGVFTNQKVAMALVERYAKHAPRFLEHDVLNPFWAPSYFADVEREMSALGLDFLGPTAVEERLDANRMTPAQRALFDRETTTAGRETLRDIIVHRMFRRDLFGRRAAPLSGAEQSARLRGTTFVLTRSPAEVFKLAKSDEAAPLVFALARDDGAPKRLDALEAEPAIAALPPGRMLEQLVVLAGAACVQPVQSQGEIEAAAGPCRRLNQRLIAIDGRSPATVLASPLIGAGVRVSGEERMAIASGRLGQIEPDRRALLARLMIA